MRSLGKEGCSCPRLLCVWFAHSPHKEDLQAAVLQQSGSPAWRSTVWGPMGGSKPQPRSPAPSLLLLLGGSWGASQLLFCLAWPWKP